MGSIKKRVLSDGKSVYDCRVHRSGSGTLSKTFKKKEDAESWARAVEGKIDRGENISRKADKTMFTVACEEYIKHYRPLKTKSRKLTYCCHICSGSNRIKPVQPPEFCVAFHPDGH